MWKERRSVVKKIMLLGLTVVIMAAFMCAFGVASAETYRYSNPTETVPIYTNEDWVPPKVTTMDRYGDIIAIVVMAGASVLTVVAARFIRSRIK